MTDETEEARLWRNLCVTFRNLTLNGRGYEESERVHPGVLGLDAHLAGSF